MAICYLPTQRVGKIEALPKKLPEGLQPWNVGIFEASVTEELKHTFTFLSRN